MNFRHFLPVIIFIPLAVIQLTIIPLISIGHVGPDLILVLVVYFALKLLNYIIPLMAVSLILIIMRTNFQPWYLLYIVSFAPLIQNRYQAFIISTVFPFFALLYKNQFKFLLTN